MLPCTRPADSRMGDRHSEDLALITQIKFVGVPVGDQDRALAFYTDKLGFEVATDQPMGPGQRWIELRIANSPTRLVLFTPPGHEDRIGTLLQRLAAMRQRRGHAPPAVAARRRVRRRRRRSSRGARSRSSGIRTATCSCCRRVDAGRFTCCPVRRQSHGARAARACVPRYHHGTPEGAETSQE